MIVNNELQNMLKEELVAYLTGVTEENHKILQSGQYVFKPRYKSGISLVRNRSAEDFI
jgi:hypothetical protein